MAVSFQNTFDGIADATAPTVANSGGTSGQAIASINVGAASTVLAKTSAAMHGARGLEFNYAGSGTDGATRVWWAASETGRLVMSFYINLSASVTAFDDIAGFTNIGGTKIMVAYWGSDGKLIIADATGTNLAASKAANIFPTGMVRVDLAVAPGTTTSNGYLGYAYYLNEDTTPVYSWESSASNAGTTAIAQVFLGRTTGRTGARVVKYDTLRVATTASGFLAPFNPGTGGGSSGSITVLSTNTAEGMNVGQVLTSADTALTGGVSGTAAATIAVGAASSIVVTDDSPAHGGRAYGFNVAANASDGATRMFWTCVRSDRAVMEFYATADVAFSAFEDLAHWRNASGQMVTLSVGADLKAVLTDVTGAVTASKSTANIPADTLIRWNLSVKKGTGTGDGVAGYAYWLPGAPSGTPTFSYESTVRNTGTADTATACIGRTTGRTGANLIIYDTIRTGFSGATNGVWFDPYVPPTVNPTADLGGNQTLVPYQTVTINAGRSNSPSASLASYTLTKVSGPTISDLTGSGPIWTYTAPAAEAAQTVVWSLVVTDTNALTSAPVSVTHSIAAHDYFGVGSNVLIPIRPYAVTA